MLSARLDGEATPDEQTAVEGHLEGCGACRGWSDGAADAGRRAVLRPAPEQVDLSAQVVAAARDASRTPVPEWPVERWLLLLVGTVMLVLAVPLLLTGGPDAHLAREAAVGDVALAVGVLIAAVQPWRASGLLPVVVVLAAGLTLTSVADVATGRVAAADEAFHALAPTAALLLWLLRRRAPAGRPAPALRVVADRGEDRRTA